MRTLLVLAQHPDLVAQVRANLNPEGYQIVHRLNAEEAEPFLAHGLADACIVDVESANVQGVWLIEKLRRRGSACPILIYTGSQAWDWEEEAYANGVVHVLRKPVRARILNAVLEQLWARTAESTTPLTPASYTPEVVKTADTTHFLVHPAAQSLKVVRDFSAVLTHSLCAEAMLKQFLLLIREIVGVNRATIFLRQSSSLFSGLPAREDGRRLRSACAIGLAPGLLEHFELSFETGIGGNLFRSGRILRRNSPEALADTQMQKEFELLSAQVAVPILDRETLVGVATFDGRVTGEPLANVELELIFHLLEQLGLAVKNIWLHDQLAASYQVLTDILRELSSACIVVSRDLTILHANRAARRHFAKAARAGAELEFSDLPQPLGSKVYQVLKTGAAIGPFRHQPEDSPAKVFNVTVVPLPSPNAASPNSALLTIEDLTQTEQLQRLEIETANLRLLKTMAERLAHEVGNAIVPVSVYLQVLREKLAKKEIDLEFLRAMEADLGQGGKRISRLVEQMRFLARDAVSPGESFPVGPLIEEAFREAQQHQPVKSAQLKYEHEKEPTILVGDRAALKHAVAEVLLNALQANLEDAKIAVRVRSEPASNGQRELQIEIHDNGPGFAPKTSDIINPGRNVGLGLGLTVTRKIIENHRGKVEIVSPKTGQAGIVRISLPQESSAKGKV